MKQILPQYHGGFDYSYRKSAIPGVDYCFCAGGGIPRTLCFCGLLDDMERYRFLEPEPDRQLGLGHHQLRMVDRYRPRRNADLSYFADFPATLAYRRKPGRRGHDNLRRDLRGAVPAHSHGASLACFLHLSVPEHPRTALAQL